ncbi:Skeletor, isoforms D/E-like protein 2 [Sarcoptes scabiei]|uniref:Skeletor, isoforms D/E-like protein 2 n=1 Tax=Sarcoptes scabiei TaxID=52283 RepID=A0A132AFT0_SARSC|nr:Skeletor, isoforms D/E-like protein 2 [Sarcoptes scabiei]
MVLLILLLITTTFSVKTFSQLVTDHYYGTPLGSLISNGPASGYVYAPDERTIFLKNFTFKGSHFVPSYFVAGTTLLPDATGFLISDEKGRPNNLGDYEGEDITLRISGNQTLRNIRWFAIWNRNEHRSMGYVSIPYNLDLPRPLEINPLTGFAHNIRSGPITIVDAQTILVPDFWYDGLGPAAYWWMTRGPRQSPQGLRLKDEKGSVRPLRAFRGETVLLSLPDTKSIYDFDWLGFQVDFGHVSIPQHIRVPPSSAMLGLKPESKLNCEILDETRNLEIRWILDNDDIVIQLVGEIAFNEYMAIGWSKDDTRSSMIGSDAVVTWIDEKGEGHAQDYFLGSKGICSGRNGSCPDSYFPGATENVILLHNAVVNRNKMITFKRPQLGVDNQYDQHIYSDGPQAIIWAYGPLNERNEILYHSNHQFGDRYLNFARSPVWNCPSPDKSLMNKRRWRHILNSTSSSETNESSSESRTTEENSQPILSETEAIVSNEQLKPWSIPKIWCPKDTILRAQMGPVGGPKGYEAITGRRGWGIAWYINGLLIPELILKRGTTYTFWIEGGNNKTNEAQRHPFYLTTSVEGGFEKKSDEERAQERIFGGVGITPNGTIVPTAEGRLCEWRISRELDSKKSSETISNTFDEFKKTLKLECDKNGDPGVLQFTPDQNTPNEIYYQCYNHRYMGWKIRIVDDCSNEMNRRLPMMPSMQIAASNIASVKSRFNQKPFDLSLKISNEFVPIQSLPKNQLLSKNITEQSNRKISSIRFDTQFDSSFFSDAMKNLNPYTSELNRLERELKKTSTSVLERKKISNKFNDIVRIRSKPYTSKTYIKLSHNSDQSSPRSYLDQMATVSNHQNRLV